MYQKIFLASLSLIIKTIKMALTSAQKFSIESKKDQIESKKRMIADLKSTVKNNKENLRSLISSSKDKAAKEYYKKRLADSGEYTLKQIEQIKDSILDLKEDIIRIKQG